MKNPTLTRLYQSSLSFIKRRVNDFVKLFNPIASVARLSGLSASLLRYRLIRRAHVNHACASVEIRAQRNYTDGCRHLRRFRLFLYRIFYFYCRIFLRTFSKFHYHIFKIDRATTNSMNRCGPPKYNCKNLYTM